MVTLAALTDAAAQLLGLAVIVAAIAAAAAFLYRWYVRERLPDGLAVLLGLSVVAVSIGTTGWLNQVIDGSDSLISATAALRNIGVFVVSAAGAYAGAHVGDRVARDVAVATGSTVIDAEVSTLVEAVGRVITVELPDRIDDVVGYDPVSPRTKEALEGKTFLFPRRLTVAALRERLIARLRTDYAVGHVDLELAADGTVEYIALGSRAAGIGPTLPPETAAVAIRADPAYAASAGDLVQVWESNPSRRILTAELRGTADDVVTLAIDAADTPKLDPETRYRLVTLPVDDRPDREFASLLRAADETLATIEVGAGSEVDGRAVRHLGVDVVAITSADDGTTTLPSADHPIVPGEVLYAIGTPEALRKLEDAARPNAGGESTNPDAGTRPATAAPTATAPTQPTDAVSEPTDDAGEAPGSDDSVSAENEGVEADDDATDGEERGDVTFDDVPTVEPIRDGHTPVFKPETERDPLVDAVPDEARGGEPSERETATDDVEADDAEVDDAEVDDEEVDDAEVDGDEVGDAEVEGDGDDEDADESAEPADDRHA